MERPALALIDRPADRPVADALEAGYLTLEHDRAVARLTARRDAGATWLEVGEGHRACLVHDRLHAGDCPECGAEANDAAAALEGRYRENGCSLLVALEAMVTLNRQGRLASPEKIAEYGELVRKVRGF